MSKPDTHEKDVAMWTSRDVQFALWPRADDEDSERLFDILPEHYWDTWRHRAFGTLSLSSCERVVTVGGWPWWVPKRLALRSVTAVAAREGVGGDARFVIERTVLPSRPLPPGDGEAS